jgi:ceramide glucosyltransferase
MHALQGLSLVLLLAVAVGSIVNLAQLAITWWTARRTPALAEPTLGISILKPLCGADDGLEENLRQFATLGYPKYELILGVKDASDAAYPLAVAAAQK